MRVLLSSLLLCAWPAVAAAGVTSGMARQDTIAFVHVGVIPMDRERVLRDQTVVVRGDRIVALGPAAKVAVPARAVQVDGREKYLLSGLADMHVHFGDVGTKDYDKLLSLFLANGITTVRDMHSTRDGGRRPDNPLLVLRADAAGGSGPGSIPRGIRSGTRQRLRPSLPPSSRA